MKKIKTLKKNYEFNNVLKYGKYYVKKHIIVYIKPNNKNENTFGVAINKHLCKAVGRNKIKRLIRANYYDIMKKLEKGYDIVFLWNKKTPVDYNCYESIKSEMNKCFEEATLLKK